MKNYMKYIPLTGFAAAIVLGSSLSAVETTPKNTSMKDQHGKSQMQSHTSDKYDHTSSRPLTAEDVLGMNIDTAGNEKIGEIDEIFIDSNTGEVIAMVVSTGGFLGMGQEQSLISPEDLRLNTDRTLMNANLSKEQIRNAPSYTAGETTSFDSVRPLGKTTGVAQNVSKRSTTAETRNERMDHNDGNQAYNSNDRTDGSNRNDRADRNQAYNSNDRTDRTNRLDGVKNDNRGLAVSELIGMSVENRQGEVIGDVDEVFLDLEKREVAGVVVSTGGFLGMGDRQTLFGIREMSFDRANEKVVLDYNRDQIREFPEYKLNDQTVFANLGDRLDRLVDPRGNNYNARNEVDGYRNNTRSNDYNAQTTADPERIDTRKGVASVRGISTESDDMTVFDQGNSTDEIAMTAAIRTAIRDDEALSNSANNVTIITTKGKVVLRGEVDSESEKTTVEKIAQSKAGRQNVTSEIVVASR